MKTKQQAYETAKKLAAQLIKNARQGGLEAAVMLMDNEKPLETLYQDQHASMFGMMTNLNLVLMRFGIPEFRCEEIRKLVEEQLHGLIVPNQSENEPEG